MLIERYRNNPILTKDSVPYPVATVHNAGVVKHNDTYIMIFRSHKLNGRSILGKAESKDGFNFTVSPEPFMVPATHYRNVVFTCGAVLEPDGTVKTYWGGADKVMCVGTAVIEELVDHCLNKPRKPI